MAQTYLTLSTYPPWPSMVLCNVILDHLMAWWTPQLLWRVSLCSWLVLKAPAERTSDVNDFVIAKLVNLFVLNQRFLLSSFHWNIWLEQSSQIWKDLFLLNLRNSTIPKVFISEIVNFPSFHIQTFHISCTPPHFTPALSDTLFTLNHTTSRQNGPPSETFHVHNILQVFQFLQKKMKPR